MNQAIAFAGYLLALGAISLLAARQIATLRDYVIGGRRLSGLTGGLSAGASDMSGWLLLGLTGLAAVAPLNAMFTAIGLLIGTYINWRFIAARLLAQTLAHDDSITLPTFFERRFLDHSGLLRWLCALCIIVFFSIYASAALVAGGKLFSSVFALDYHTSIIGCASFIAAYTIVGGFLAVSWTDALQALLMLGALIAAALVSGAATGFATSLLAEQSISGVAALSGLAWGLGYVGQPHILARFMALSSEKQVRSGAVIGISWTAFSLIAAVCVGVFGAHLLGANLDHETVFLRVIEQHFHPLVAGLCLAAVLAAIMSTADSQLLVVATTVVVDLRSKSLNSHSQSLTSGRLLVGVVTMIALAIAWHPGQHVLALVAYAWAGFGATFGP
ncbi:MAG: sodium/proline symporter, partial [Pseudomonadota bacterium]